MCVYDKYKCVFWDLYDLFPRLAYWAWIRIIYLFKSVLYSFVHDVTRMSMISDDGDECLLFALMNGWLDECVNDGRMMTFKF